MTAGPQRKQTAVKIGQKIENNSGDKAGAAARNLRAKDDK